jgi:hypothetical protein
VCHFVVRRAETYGELSDVDLRVDIDRALTAEIFVDLEQALLRTFGPARARYDPDFVNVTTEQHVRFSFYRLPFVGVST